MVADLKGRVALVTGSSRGIGKAIAMGLAQRGCKVVVVARTTEPGKLPGTIYGTAEEIRALGGETIPLYCDVADETSVQKVVQATLAEWGRIDILINNAGIVNHSSLLETSSNIWDLVMAVNLKGTFNCIRAVLPNMMDRRQGSIVNISSTAADTIFSLIRPRQGKRRLVAIAYAVSKAGIERLTVGLAAEVGEYNIAVNALKPAFPVATEAFKSRVPQSDWEQGTSPHNMVKAAVFLASQDASGVTGTVTTDEELILGHGL